MTFRAVLPLLTLLVLPFAAAAEGESFAMLEAKPVKLSMFKNGVSLVFAKVELPEASGNYRVRPLPDSLLGSFWLYAGEGVELSDVRATQAESVSSVPASNMRELLEANIGKRVWAKFEERWQQVTIAGLPNSGDPAPYPPAGKVIPPPQPGPGEIVLINDGNMVQAMPIHWIESLRFEEGAGHTFNKRVTENVVQFVSTPTERGGASDVIITYLARGAAWSPSYILGLDDDGKAKITAKAIIVNDLLPLENVSAEMIAGFPNIRFADIQGAFTLAPLNQIIERMAGIRERRQDEGIMSQISNRAMAGRAYFAMGDAMTAAPSQPLAGEQTEELYFYQVENLTLKMGERGYIPMFEAEVPFKHKYTWNIPDFIDANDNYRQDLAEAQADIWHAAEATNTHNQPWTSAPVTVMRDNRIMGQDVMEYTAPGASVDIKITKVTAVQADQKEFETERQRNAATYNRTSYDLVTVKGELVLVNYKSEPMTVEITKRVSGEVQDTTGDPEITKLIQGLRTVNPSSQIVWTVEAKPGKDNAVRLEYTYQVLVRA